MRRFTSASAEYIEIGSAGLAGFNYLFGTVAALVYTTTINNDNVPFSTNHGTGACAVLDLDGGAGDTLAWFDGTNQRTSAVGLATGAWQVLVGTKATGTATPNLHEMTNGLWTHMAASGTSPNSAANTSVTVGAFDNTGTSTLDGEIAQIGTWDYAMTDLQVERLSKVSNYDWARLGAEMWERMSEGRQVGDMRNTLGRKRVTQTARNGTTRGVQLPPPGFMAFAPRRRR